MFSIFKKKKDTNLLAFLSGKVLPITEVLDEVFSSKSLGDGIGIEPIDNILVSPIDAEVTFIAENSNHACVIKAQNDMEIMLHIGIDTVNMKGDGFSCLVKTGDKVKKGQKLIEFDKSKISKAGYSDTTMMIIIKEGNAKNITLNTQGEAIINETILATFE